MDKSIKSPKKEATYIITSHGTLLSDYVMSYSFLIKPMVQEAHSEKKVYYAITIPKNVELYTFTELGNSSLFPCATHDYICDYSPEKKSGKVFNVSAPLFKFVYEEGKQNKFPNLFLTPDNDIDIAFYSGIIHCIPYDLRGTTLKAKEIIYNMDAKYTKDCACGSISINSESDGQPYPYDCDEKYSDYYKDQLKGYEYDITRSIKSINKCGPILLSEALELIQMHSKTMYDENTTLKIYITGCLNDIELNNIISDFDRGYKTTNSEIIVLQGKISAIKYNISEIVRQISTNAEALEKIQDNDKGGDIIIMIENISQLLQKDSFLNKQLKELENILRTETINLKQKTIHLDYYKDGLNHNTINKINKQEVVYSLDDFTSISLSEPTYSTYIFKWKNKIFKIKTYKKAFMAFDADSVIKIQKSICITNDKDCELASEEELEKMAINKLENINRTQYLTKLESYLIDAIHKLYQPEPESGRTFSFIDLPDICEINLAFPLNKTTLSTGEKFSFTNIIYKELLKLIIQKNLGGNIRKKTLRKKRKHPYIKKKTARRKNFYKKNLAKKA